MIQLFLQYRVTDMDRKYLFLNNDLSMMLSREMMHEFEDPEEWKEEQKSLRERADEIISSPENNINCNDILQRSISYAHVAEDYLKLFVNGTDSEQLKELSNIEYAASMTLLPESLLIAGHKLVEEHRFQEWLVILKHLRFVPLQKALCYDIKTHDDFLDVLKSINPNDLDFPYTFLWSFLNHWLEWLIQTENKLNSYLDINHVYDTNEFAQSLKKEASAIKQEWDAELPSMIHEILSSFSQFLKFNDLFVWATKKNLREDEQRNPYSLLHNHIIRLIWEELISHIYFNDFHYENANLNMLILLSEAAVKENNEDLAKKLYENLKSHLIKENYASLDKKSSVDERRQLVISKLLDVLAPQDNYNLFIDDLATRFQGWNLNYQDIYNEVRRESYLLCCIFRIFQIKTFPTDKLLQLWKAVVDLSLLEYSRCDNEYLKSDEFCMPFRVAIEVAEELDNQDCREYLQDGIINTVLSITSVLTIFSECNIKLSSNIISKILSRIDVEWDSAKILMNMRGQNGKVKRFEDLIDQIRKFNLAQ